MFISRIHTRPFRCDNGTVLFMGPGENYHLPSKGHFSFTWRSWKTTPVSQDKCKRNLFEFAISSSIFNCDSACFSHNHKSYCFHIKLCVAQGCIARCNSVFLKGPTSLIIISLTNSFRELLFRYFYALLMIIAFHSIRWLSPHDNIGSSYRDETKVIPFQRRILLGDSLVSGHQIYSYRPIRYSHSIT